MSVAGKTNSPLAREKVNREVGSENMANMSFGGKVYSKGEETLARGKK